MWICTRFCARHKEPWQKAALVKSIWVLLCFSFVSFFVSYRSAERHKSTDPSHNRLDRTSVLVLNIISLGSLTNTYNPYRVVITNWPSTSIYLMLSVANWLILAASALIWLVQTVQILRRKLTLSSMQWWLWSLYTAYTTLTALAILADLSGFLGANLQLRIFPAFGILAAPIVAQQLQLPAYVTGYRRQAAAVCLGVALAILGGLSVIKATNEPSISNNWIFATEEDSFYLQNPLFNTSLSCIVADHHARLVNKGLNLLREFVINVGRHGEIKAVGFWRQRFVQFPAYRIEIP
mmetsp:Transcript_8487/g.23501  ORF Transcript_8487/g.23501 Transcript_8487/m.23501 type:complete len:294 (-) Transcript_8487:1580-2461(-)